MPRYCQLCGKELEPDEKKLCTHCNYHQILDEFEGGHLG